MSGETDESTRVEIAIIGAGIAGIGMAMALRKDGHRDFVVLERAADLGGTWRDNTYPGCACDVPSVLYSYAEDPNPEWTHGFAPQPEIQAYVRRVAERHGVERFVRYGHELLSADWDETGGVWELRTSQGRYTAELVVSATGALADPRVPDLPGLETFTGTSFHSARWDHGHELSGRQVAVIGNGASAIQFVPEIQPRVDRLTLFQRTPSWVLPRDNPPVSAGWRARFARRPWMQRALRGGVFRLIDGSHVGFSHPSFMRGMEAICRLHLARQVRDRELRARLVPNFRFGCKRMLFSNTWYPAISAPNAEVVSGGIREVVPDGIVDGDGRHHAVDTIIFATGFHVTDLPVAERIRGRGRTTLADSWAGSPRLHLGMSVNGYPNLFFLLGPSTGLGNNSVLLMIEAQVAYLRKLLRHRARWGYGSVEPTVEAQARFDAEIDRGNAGSVWTAGGCTSWYLDRSGRQSALWPGTVAAYQRRLAHLVPGDYAIGAPRPDGGRPVRADAPEAALT